MNTAILFNRFSLLSRLRFNCEFIVFMFCDSLSRHTYQQNNILSLELKFKGESVVMDSLFTTFNRDSMEASANPFVPLLIFIRREKNEKKFG